VYNLIVHYVHLKHFHKHITKVHRCGIYANIPAGGLSIRQRPYSSSSKNSQRTLSTSSVKQGNSRHEIIYRCSLCRSKFTHLRAIERHHYDVHRIDPFDIEAMKNATIEDEEIIENEQIEEQDMNNRDDDEQMAIIQFRNQHQNAEQSPLIVKIERGFLENLFIFLFNFLFFHLDGYDNFETADDFLSTKPTSRTRQLQKSRRRLSKNSIDHSLNPKKVYSNVDMKEQYDDYIEDDDYEYETGDTFVENIVDDENFIDDDDDNANLIFKYRSSTQKSI
jgi:hypothetical protein